MSPPALGLMLVVAVVGGVAGTPQDALGQEEISTCEDTLEVAEKAYQNSNYERAIRLASQCTDPEAVGERTAMNAYRRQALAHLRQGNLIQGRAAVANILEIDPTYTADPIADPPSYSFLVSTVRQRRDQESAESVAEEAESDKGVGMTFFAKLGMGVSDYTGDFPSQNSGHPLDFQEFTRGSGVPFLLNEELGYQLSPNWSLAAGFQGGNYPIVGYGGSASGISDSWRYTPHVLVRYTFGTPSESPSFYLDGGVNVTFGGDARISTGIGPSVGGGVEFPLGGPVSFYVESRFHGTLPDDAIDGSDGQRSFLSGIDSVNQLLGAGLKVSLGERTPTRR